MTTYMTRYVCKNINKLYIYFQLMPTYVARNYSVRYPSYLLSFFGTFL